MHKCFKLCASEHTFWLLLPTLCFVTLTLSIGPFLFLAILYAAIPMLLILLFSAITFRLKAQKKPRYMRKPYKIKFV